MNGYPKGIIKVFIGIIKVFIGQTYPQYTLMIPIEWLSKRLKLQTQNSPKWLKNGYFTWITLIISIAAMLLSKRLFHINLPILPFWLVMSILITLRYKPAVFHNLICPFGALQRMFGRFARLSKKVNADACIGCMLCEKACPSNAIIVSEEDNKAGINTALCHQCTNCSQICPKNAIHYGK